MNSLEKIVSLFTNIGNIYGPPFSKAQKFSQVFLSFIFLPIYILIIFALALLNLIQFALYSPLILSRMIMGYGQNDPMIGIVTLPITTAYFAFFLLSIIPSVLLGLICDGVAEVISFHNHKPDYVIVWPQALVGAHYSEYH